MKDQAAPLGNFVEVNPEGISKGYPHDEILYIDISSVGSGHFVENPKTLSLNEAPSRAKRIVRDGDTILATVRPNLRSFLFIKEPETNTIASTGFAVLRATEKADPRFIYYAVTDRRFTGYLTNNTKGTSYPAVDTDTVLRGEVPDFNLQRQHAISSILSAYDDLIENNRRRIQLLEQAARLLHKEWFVHLRFPGHEHVTIKDGVPEGWEKMTVPDVIDINPKETVPGETTIRYIPMAGLSTTGMTVDLGESEVRDKSTSVRFRNADVLLARITPCLENGKTGFVNFLATGEIACGSTEFIVLRGKLVSPYFTYCLARTHDFRGTAIKSMIGSSGRQRVQSSCFDEFAVALPPPLLLETFDGTVRPVFRQIRILMAQTRRLSERPRPAFTTSDEWGDIRMSDTVFTKVDYDLGSLVKFIGLGEIGLPDIQRPFVWPNWKVRDLFDSMYRGYPVGYLLFWQNGLPDDRAIGTDAKQKAARLVIVDGQQRLTSLYAVIKGVSVVRKNYESERVCIAFNPLEEKLEVADAAIKRDKAFIPDISVLWSGDVKITKIIREYIKALKTTREVTEQEESAIEDGILRLQGLLSFPFTALELAADISEEDVSDVFVRINSKGTTLNQADFILTLMSVFWDEGRAKLESFCRGARKPTKGTASPFNHFIEPSPDQLLRVDVGVGFKRARLQYVYSILRGKDLETGEFSDERRVSQFDVLKEAQVRTLNIQYWHDFLNCIRMAGFRSGRMISSKNNLLFSYMLYLIGRTEYGVEEFALRNVIAQWFFMSAVTGRFTGSPESAMEFDLARLRDVKYTDEFVSTLRHVCDITLTNDFWNVTLPNDLATSSSRSPSLFAYNAALVLLDARVLFSNAKVAELLDPTIQAKRSSIERHHLFPKGYLATLGITGTRQTNQIANYAYVEWLDNMKISDQAPADYVPQLKERSSEVELARMYHCHALPEDWEQMEYRTFLEKRREMMAQVIQEGYQTLTAGPEVEAAPEEFDVTAAIGSGESAAVEFKSTMRINMHTGEPDKRMELSVLKTLAGFLNTNGGTLILGVSDDGTPVGIEADKFPNEDKMSLHLVNIVKARIGPQAMTAMHVHFEHYNGGRVMAIRCKRSSAPVFVKDGEDERFYVRTGPSTTELKASQTQDYVKQRF